MKKTFYFLLGISLILLTSATTASIMTVKPANPKVFVVKEFTDADYNDVQAKYIRKMIKKGWVLKSQSLAGKQYTLYGIVVMEKY
jgi:FAD synthase